MMVPHRLPIKRFGMQVLSMFLVLDAPTDPSLKLGLTGIPWELVTKITTPLTLIAFGLAIWYALNSQRIRGDERILTELAKGLSKDQKAAFAGRFRDRYGVPVNNLSPKDCAGIVKAELEKEYTERRYIASLFFAAFAFASILWFVKTLPIDPRRLIDSEQVWVQGNVYDADGTPIERDASVSVPGQPDSFPTAENGRFRFRIPRSAVLAGDSVAIVVRAYGKTLVDSAKVGDNPNRLRFSTLVRPADHSHQDATGAGHTSQAPNPAKEDLDRLENAATADNQIGIYGRNIPAHVMKVLRSRLRARHRVTEIAFFGPSGYVLIEDEKTARYEYLPDSSGTRLRRIFNEGKRIGRVLTFPSSPSSWLVLYGDNEWDGGGLPSGLMNELDNFRNFHRQIRDVTLLPGDGWLIIDDDDGVKAVNGGEFEERLRDTAHRRSRPVVQDADTWFFLRGWNDADSRGIGADLDRTLAALRTPSTRIVTFALTPAGGWILLTEQSPA